MQPLQKAYQQVIENQLYAPNLTSNQKAFYRFEASLKKYMANKSLNKLISLALGLGFTPYLKQKGGDIIGIYFAQNVVMKNKPDPSGKFCGLNTKKGTVNLQYYGSDKDVNTYIDESASKHSLKIKHDSLRVPLDNTQLSYVIDKFISIVKSKHQTKCSEDIDNYSVQEISLEQEYVEGEKHLREVSYFKRNAMLVKEAKAKFGFICQVCEFDFEVVYGKELGSGFIECHHKNPLYEKDRSHSSTLDDVCVVCSNCHRMLHRTKPAMKPEQLKEKLRKKVMNSDSKPCN